jgi:hypothetical protein
MTFLVVFPFALFFASALGKALKRPRFMSLGGSLSITLTANSYQINELTSYSFLLSAEQKLTDGNCLIVFTFPQATGVQYQSPLSCSVGNGFSRTPICSVSSTSPDLVVRA